MLVRLPWWVLPVARQLSENGHYWDGSSRPCISGKQYFFNRKSFFFQPKTVFFQPETVLFHQKQYFFNRKQYVFNRKPYFHRKQNVKQDSPRDNIFYRKEYLQPYRVFSTGNTFFNRKKSFSTGKSIINWKRFSWQWSILNPKHYFQPGKKSFSRNQVCISIKLQWFLNLRYWSMGGET